MKMDLENQNNKDPAGVPDYEKPQPSSPPQHEAKVEQYQQLLKQTPMIVIMFATMALSCLVLFHSSVILPFSGDYRPIVATNQTANSLNMILKNAAMDNNTVVITSLNDAWAEPQSMFDLLRESFRIGNQTERFLKHLVVVAVDQKAYARCLKVHPHCYHLITNGSDFSEEADFMTPDYLKIVWRKIDFLGKVLDLGYSFVFTDADIMWFRDPFSQLDKDDDFQVACDRFNGNPNDLRNLPNTGFSYVKSNEKTIQFYKFWYNSRLTFQGHDQDVFNRIKFDPLIKNTGLKIRFLDTAYFGGFCQPSRDLNKVCTMHANCCIGLDNKIHDLGVMLDDWRKYINSRANQTKGEYEGHWTDPKVCRDSLHHPRVHKKKVD